MDMKRTTGVLIAILTLVFFASSVQGAKIKKVSERKTNAFLKQFESDHQKAWVDSKEQMLKRTPVWVQPENKDEECKVVMIMPEGEELPNVKFYWDGECKEGYAFGLGRAFGDSTQGLSVWLEEYNKPNQLPLNYYLHNYDLKFTKIGFQDSKEPNPLSMNGSTFQFQKNVSQSNFSIGHSIFDPEMGVAYHTSTNSSIDQLRKSMVFTNGTGIVFDYFSDPTQQIRNSGYFFDFNKNIAIGFGIMVGRDGQVGHLKYQDGVSTWVKLPENFVMYMAKLEREIDAQLNKINTHVQRGTLALEVYKRRTCSGELNVDFMDNILYGQICLENGDFTPYIDKIEELQVKAQKRQAANAQTAQAQAEINANRFAAAAEQQRAQQAQTSQALAIAAQQSANTLNNLLNMNAELSRNYSPPTFNFAPIRKGNVSVCHVRSNIVFCN